MRLLSGIPAFRTCDEGVDVWRSSLTYKLQLGSSFLVLEQVKIPHIKVALWLGKSCGNRIFHRSPRRRNRRRFLYVLAIALALAQARQHGPTYALSPCSKRKELEANCEHVHDLVFLRIFSACDGESVAFLLHDLQHS